MKERLFKKRHIQNVSKGTTNKCLLKCCATNFIHNACRISLWCYETWVHDDWQKMEPWVNFISCDIFLQACGGWAGSSQNCVCRSFVLPTQLRFPPSFLTQFCGGRSNVWIICNGGVSTNLNINGEIQIYETLDMKSCSIEFPNLLCEEKDQMSHKRSVMSNKRNAVMSVIHVVCDLCFFKEKCGLFRAIIMLATVCT